MKLNFYRIFLVASIFFFLTSDAYTQVDEGREHMRLQKEIVLPTTPEASSLGEYGDVEVNKYTGTANLTFGGPSLIGNHIGMPVTLQYATGGIKVEDMGTWVGLGFTLQAGGSITRAMRHVPDTHDNYYSKADSISKYNTAPGASQNLFHYYGHYEDVARDGTETTQDIFYYSFNGRSGKFYISPDKEVFQSIDSDVRITPTFNASDQITSFTITDEFGHQYLFSERETSTMVIDPQINGPNQVALAEYSYTFNSTWYLTKITSYGDYEEITLAYASEGIYDPPFNGSQYESRTFTDLDQCCGGTVNGNLSSASPDNVRVNNRKYLTQAYYELDGTVYQQLEFSRSANNCAYAQSSDRKLDQIKVFRKRDVGSNLNHILDYRFNYDCSTDRLTLKEYGPQKANSDNFNLQPPHSYSYSAGVLPDPTSNRIDHWGYHNGRANSSGLIPSYSSTDHTYNGANRDVRPSHLEYGSLARVTYPTKGYTILDYEPNTRTIMAGSVQYQCSGGSCSNRSNCHMGSACCNGGATFISEEYDYIPDVNIASSGYMFITADSLCGGGAIPGENSWTGQLRIRIDGSIIFDTTFTDIHVSTKIPVFSHLTAGVTHTLLIEGDNVDVNTQMKYRTVVPSTTTENIAGLRIATISSYDINGSLLTEKTYDYNYPGTSNSSGKLMNEPDYITIGSYEHHLVTMIPPCSGPCCSYECDRVTVSATSRSTLGTTQGSHVGYDFVTETIENGALTAGYTRYEFYNVPHSDNTNVLDHYRNGSILSEEVFTSGNQLVQRKEYKYSFDIGDDRRQDSYFHSGLIPSNTQDNQEFLARNPDGSYFWTEELDEANNADAYIVAPTKYIHDFEIISDYTKYISSVCTTNYFYDEGNRNVSHTQVFVYDDTTHLQLTSQLDTNSNMAVHQLKYQYGPDYSEIAEVGTIARMQNRLLPAWSIIHDVDGTRIDESFWTLRQIGSGSGAIIADTSATLNVNKSFHPYQTWRYEYTWDENGNGSGATVLQWRDTLYSPTAGMLMQRRGFGWDLAEDYTWSASGKLSRWQQGDHIRNFGYSSTTDLFTSIEEI